MDEADILAPSFQDHAHPSDGGTSRAQLESKDMLGEFLLES
jgi:hypothetical protein